MIYYIESLKGESWWGGAVAHGTEMPIRTGGATYELNGTINRTDNQYNGLFVSSCGRYIYVEGGCILNFDGNSLTISEAKGLVEMEEGHGTLKGAYRAAAEKHL